MKSKSSPDPDVTIRKVLGFAPLSILRDMCLHGVNEVHMRKMMRKYAVICIKQLEKIKNLPNTNKPYFAKYLPVKGEIKAKLFLCSRDIQVGDKYFHDDFYPYPVGDIADTNTKVMNAHMMVSNEGEDYEGDWSYKVVGEISPEATWVKEGDEFDEDEVSRCFYGKECPGGKVKIKGLCGGFH